MAGRRRMNTRIALSCAALIGAASVASAQTAEITALPAGCPAYTEVGLNYLVDQLDTLMAQSPEQRWDVNFLSMAATVYATTENGDCALQFASRLVVIAPDIATSYLARAMVQLSRRDAPAAVADANRAVELARAGGSEVDRVSLTGGSAEGLISYAIATRSSAYRAAGDPDKALADINSLIESGGARGEAVSWLDQRAGIYIQMRRYDDAITDCDTLQAARPESAGECTRIRADAHFGKGEFDLAIVAYDENVRTIESGQQMGRAAGGVAPGYTPVFQRVLGHALLRACRAKVRGGLLDAAAADCARALELAPNDAYAFIAAADLARARGDAARAAEYDARAAAADPEAARRCSGDAPCP